jgi:hypothetical protein
MHRMIFTVVNYSAMHRTKVGSFAEAVETAHRYANIGGLPATITDTHGCRWTVWQGAKPELQECPGETAQLLPGYRCDCEVIY